NSYSPYSKFRVGACLLTEEGEVFCGTNVENGSFGGTICAERVAFSKAVSEGYRNFKSICIAGLDCDDFLYPCGICLQFMSEFASNLEIIVTNKKKDYKVYKISELFPYAFSFSR
ncbi:MAG TPA: cytidine deaminase, partial [Spirochaetota bacterium]|nr:cytidine deaminase [Spirochaetota bacterium]